MKKIAIHNLDIAAYLAMRGHAWSMEKQGDVSTKWTFENSKRVREDLETFWKGEATVQLNRWIAARSSMKIECKNRPIFAGKKAIKATLNKAVAPGVETPFKLIRGIEYWFRDGSGNVLSNFFGDTELHMARLREGNFYRTKEDAQLKRNPVTV